MLDENVVSKDIIHWTAVSEVIKDILDQDGNFDLTWFELNWSLLSSSNHTSFSDLNEKTLVFLFIYTLTSVYTEFKVITTSTALNYNYSLVNKILNDNSIILDPYRVSYLSSNYNNDLINSTEENLYDLAFDEIIRHQKKILRQQLTNHYQTLYNLDLNSEDEKNKMIQYFILDFKKGIHINVDDEFERFFYHINFSKKDIEKIYSEEVELVYAKLFEWIENDFTGVVL